MLTGDLWVIYALMFGAAVLAIQGGYLLIARTRQEQNAINRRLVLGTRLGSPTEVLETLRRERGLGTGSTTPAFRALQDLVVQTGLRIDWARLMIWIVALAAVLFAVFFYAFRSPIIALPGAIVLALSCAYLFLTYVRSKRIARFGEQMPDALDVIVRGLRAGHPFRVAVGLVAREMSDPIGTEFGIMADEVTFGLDLNTAVDNLYQRVGHEDLSFFAVAINIQSQTGGNLAEILARLSHLIRSRAKLRLKVRALSSEGRLSAVCLSLAPFILFLVVLLISPGYFAEIRNHPVLVPALVIGFLLLGVGNVIMYRMVNFKF